MDFAQAYNCVDLNYLRFMLKSMGFRVKWMMCIEVAVFTSIMSISVNGSPTEEFQGSRGLRQGDPLSSFLFTIMVEGLAGMVRKVVCGGL